MTPVARQETSHARREVRDETIFGSNDFDNRDAVCCFDGRRGRRWLHYQRLVEHGRGSSLRLRTSAGAKCTRAKSLLHSGTVTLLQSADSDAATRLHSGPAGDHVPTGLPGTALRHDLFAGRRARPSGLRTPGRGAYQGLRPRAADSQHGPLDIAVTPPVKSVALPCGFGTVKNG